MKKTLLLSVASMLFMIPNQANAAIVYDTFGPGNSYQEGIGWTVGLQSQVAPYYGDYMDPAAAFTPTANYDLTSVEAAISLYSGVNSVELLLTNSINNQPGSTLETFSFTDQMGPLGQNNTPLIANSVNNIELIAGDQYWLEAKTLDPANTTAAWNFSNTDGLMLDSDNSGSTWFNLNSYYPNQGAFLISGNPTTGSPLAPVPETPTMALLTLGLIGMAAFKRNTAFNLLIQKRII